MDDFQEMPGHLIRRFQQIAVAIFMDEAGRAGVDLTPVQFAALASLDEHPGLDQATLAGMIAYDRSTIGGVVDRLVHKGLVARHISERDRRARELRLTVAGRALLAEVRPVVRQAQEAMLAGLDPAEQRQLIALLRKATDAANDRSRAPLRIASE